MNIKEQFEKELLEGLDRPNMATVDGFIDAIRKVDPKAEFLDGMGGMGIVTLFIEPNKFIEIAELVYQGTAMGIYVRCLPHPDFLPNSDHLRRINWW